MSEKKFPLSLIIRAFDQTGGAFASVAAKINKATGPMSALGVKFSKLGDALHLEPAGAAIQNVGSKAFGLATMMGGLAAGAGLAFGAVIKGAMDAGDSLGEHAGRVNMAVDAYASLRYSAEQNDVSADSFASSLDKLNKQMGDMKAGKGGEFLHFLNEISPALAKQMKGAKSTEEGLALMTDALARIPDSQRRATLSAHAFGKSNLQMGEWLHQGSAAIQAQQVQFLRLHGSMEKFAKGAGDLDNATRRTETAFIGLRDAAAGELFPALAKVADAATGFAIKNRDRIAAWAEKSGAALSAWVDGGGIERVATGLGDIADKVGKVVDFLGPMGLSVVAATAVFGPLGVSLLAAIPPLVMFGTAAWTAMAPIMPFVAAGVALSLVGKKIYDNWGSVTAVWDTVKEKILEVRFAIVDTWAKVRPIVSAMSVLPGFGGALQVGDYVAGKHAAAIEESTGQSVAAINARQITAESARNAGRSLMSESRVTVDFKNLPPGARVSSESTGSPIDLSMGYDLASGF